MISLWKRKIVVVEVPVVFHVSQGIEQSLTPCCIDSCGCNYNLFGCFHSLHTCPCACS